MENFIFCIVENVKWTLTCVFDQTEIRENRPFHKNLIFPLGISQ